MRLKDLNKENRIKTGQKRYVSKPKKQNNQKQPTTT
jgi:hypothetical protein